MTGKALEKIIASVQNDSSVVLESGEYHFWSDCCRCVEGYHFSNTASAEENPRGAHPVAIFLKKKKNVCIDGNGCKIVVHGIMTPLIFDRCENLVVKNMTIDYARPTMSEFTVLKKVDGGYIISIAKDSLFDIVGARIIWHGERGRDGKYLWAFDYRDYMSISMYKDPETERVRVMGRDSECKFPCVPEFSSVADLGGGLLKVTLKEEKAFFPVGCTVQTRNTVRDQIGGAFVNCKNILFEKVTIRAMHGLGLLAQLCDTVTFRNINITPSAGRTTASNADFFHVSNCCGKITVEGCVCSDGHDDFINVHGTHLKIEEIEYNTLRVGFVELHSYGFCPFKRGDRIDFIDRLTLLPYGGVTVKSVSIISELEFLLTADEEIRARVGDYVENATMTPEVLIKNNKFGPSMGRGILCTTRKKVVIENNLFYKTGGNVLCIEDDCNFWFESGYTTDVSFVNNRVVACGYGSLEEDNVPVISVNPQVVVRDKPVYVHKRISVENNEFSDLPKNSYIAEIKNTEEFIFLTNTSDCIFEIKSKQVKKTEIQTSENLILRSWDYD